MSRRKWMMGFAGALMGMLPNGCRADLEVGDPCIPEDEYVLSFSGFSASEVQVEHRSFQCMTRLCLVNHFQGRVSCPRGQSKEELGLSGSDPNRCRMPGSNDASDAITQPVPAWDVDRPPERAVYCSCRCDGPDEGARYCECPTGFSCTELVPDVGFGAHQLPGSYCVRDGTEFERLDLGGPTCRSQPDDPACNSRH